ncbi:MAG TPA: glycosyl hydrolase family 28-related protein [Stellaceae bacterium]|nr:glycosyl hydrolase family 28-related protein [Stellaceae bacterium]
MRVERPGPDRRGVLVAGAAAALAARPNPVRAAPHPGRTLSAARFGAVGDGIADDTKPLQAALDASLRHGGTLLVIPPGTYRVTRTLRLMPNRSTTGDIGRHCGVLAHGARLLSAITDGGNVLEVTSRATVRYVLIEGLDVLGTGKEGHGIVVACDRTDDYLYNFCLRDAVVQGCGRDGCRLVGNVFEGQIVDSYFRNNHGNGITLTNGTHGGILSAIHVFGAVCGNNGGHGAALMNGCYDVGFHGCYFLLNGQFGLAAGNGCTLLSNCGFENNHAAAGAYAKGGAGIDLGSFGTLIGCTGYSRFYQNGLIRAFVTAPFVMVGCSGAGDGTARDAGLARLAGTAAGEAVIVGCKGRIDYAPGFEALEIGGPDGGVRFGADWRSRYLPRLGEYRLWIDRAGRLRLKKGAPAADDDGVPLGPQAD